MTKRTGATWAAIAAGLVLLAGCDADGDGVDDDTGKPVASASADQAASPAGGCDPSGFGPLSGCDDAGGPDTGQSSPMSKDDWPGAAAMAGMLADTSPDGGGVFVVTKKYHADSKSCVESRIPHDPHQQFQRVCVPDEYATAQDRDWLAHQIVGQPQWAGGGS